MDVASSWTELCRCCLSPEAEVSLFDDKLNVSEKFLVVTTIQVKAEDNLPQKLCMACYTIMDSAYQFRNQCIDMDNELKLQLKALFYDKTGEVLLDSNEENNNFNEDSGMPTDEEIANDPVKQLEAIIKKEPVDLDDDCYYVLVIDKPTSPQMDDLKNIDSENGITIKHEVEIPEQEEEINENTTCQQNFLDSFLVANDKVPDSVPATILENEESQDSDEHFNAAMDIDDTQNSNSQEINKDHNFEINEDSQSQIEEIIVPTSDNSIFKILTNSATAKTILVKDGIEYLTNAELLTNEDGEPLTQEEVILCEGDEDSSQIQILKCEGSELIIEYAEDGQIATVLQQSDGAFVCDCGQKFMDLSEYEKHQHTHNPAGDNLCNICGKGFESPEILTGHKILHHVSGLIVTCPFCSQQLKRNVLTQHIKYAHNNIKPRCEICDKTFANPNNLKRHMMIHSGIKEFECDICLKRFHQKITMQTHRLTHMNPLACTECDKTFENKDDLTNHRESNQCSRSKVLRVKQELMKTVKQEVTTDLGKVLGYACSLCKKMFSVESALEQHIESSHIVDPHELLCGECGEIMSSRRDMQSHILTHKNVKMKNAKRFECPTCGKGCSSQAMLVMHERVHTNERPFHCDHCPLKFKTKTHLRTHQLTHTREKKFGCPVCRKFFALKGNLVVHLRTHTGERPYICSICSESFIDSKYLKKHKLKKHAIENVPYNQY